MDLIQFFQQLHQQEEVVVEDTLVQYQLVEYGGIRWWSRTTLWCRRTLEVWKYSSCKSSSRKPGGSFVIKSKCPGGGGTGGGGATQAAGPTLNGGGGAGTKHTSIKEHLLPRAMLVVVEF
jgi:hypothetical protein